MKTKISAIQLNSKLDYQDNLLTIKKLLREAKEMGSEIVFLPECFYSMSNGESATPYLVEKDNEHYHLIKNLAQEFQVYLIGGSAATRDGGTNIFNRAYNFSPEGEDLGTYDKIHLFACNINDPVKKVNLNEGRTYTAGIEEKLITIKNWVIGLSICFDLRFPEMFRDYRRAGANILCIPAAFTVPTGKAHWHTLLRTRAIENQCYVVASAQWGRHNEKIETFGHSLIIDPWGNVLSDAGEGEKIISATLDLGLVEEVRTRMTII